MSESRMIHEFPTSCSCLALTSKQGRSYWFRTCDLHTSVWEAGTHVVSFPARQSIQLAGGPAQARYALLGVTYNDRDTWLLDGINSQGLTGGLLLLEEGTSVSAAAEGRTGVMGMELVTALLASCRTVAEVCRAARRIQLTHIPADGGMLPATMHYFFVDAAGDTVVLEAADPQHPGCLQCYREDSIGVLTNSPPYPLQLDNLRWFLSQSMELHRGGDDCPICQPAWEGVPITGNPSAPHMTRSGDLPASYAPYDRFVRLAVMKALNHDGRSIDDAQMLPMGAGILGTVREPPHQGIYHYRHLDGHGMPVGNRDGYTQYEVMYDLTQRTMYLRPFDATVWTRTALAACPEDRIARHSISHSAMGGTADSTVL